MAEITTEDTSTILNILKQIPLMEELNEEDHKEIIKHITLEYFPKDYIIFREGDAGDAFYIIKKGMIRVYHENEDPTEEKDVANLGSEEFFGEMALISEKPRNATVKTLEETEVFRLMKDDFINLVSSTPGMANKISDKFLDRFKQNIREELND